MRVAGYRWQAVVDHIRLPQLPVLLTMVDFLPSHCVTSAYFVKGNKPHQVLGAMHGIQRGPESEHHHPKDVDHKGKCVMIIS